MERLTVLRKDGRASIENKMDRNTPLQQAMRIPDVIDRLAAIEDILGDNYDLDRLRELVEADREGRCRIHPKPENNTCGSCGHFQRISGRRCGTCDVHSKYKDRYGRVDDRRGAFTPPQSKKACKSYEPREE